MPRLQMTAVDVVVTYAPAASYAAAAAREAGATAVRAEGVKRSKYKRDLPGPGRAAILFVPFGVESCGPLRSDFLQFMGQLGSIAAGGGRISKGAFLRWAMQLLSVSLQL